MSEGAPPCAECGYTKEAPVPDAANMAVLALWNELESDWRYTGTGMGAVIRTGLDMQAVDWRVRFLGIEWTYPLYQKLQRLEHLELAAQAQRLRQKPKPETE